jgi:RNA polymerase sigma-70 factor, ECF subfamily
MTFITPQTLTDEDLAFDFARGNHAALDQLYQRYFFSLVQYFRTSRRSSQPDSEDLAQRTFLAVMKKIEQFQPSLGSFRSWLYTIAQHEHVSFWRYLSIRGCVRWHAISEVDGRRDIIARSSVKQTLEKLPEHLRQIFVLHYIEGFTIQEIAAILKCPSGTVASRLARGRAEISRCRRRPAEEPTKACRTPAEPQGIVSGYQEGPQQSMPLFKGAA